MTSLDGRVRSGPDGPDGAPAAETPPDGEPLAAGAGAGTEVEGADAATVRRVRPSRTGQTGGLPTSGPAAAPAPAGPPSGAQAHDPPRRPVPPTFPSPGQPPPAVARRAGRHARPEAQGADRAMHTPPEGYRPRHAAPDAETEQFAAVPATGPGGAGLPATPPVPPAPPVPPTPVRAPLRAAAPLAPPREPGAGGPPLDDDQANSERVRVVLAERRAPTRAVRTVAEIEQQTETGELLLGNLLRAQLTLGLRLGTVAVLLFGALPVLFLVLPGLGGVSVLGVRLPWLLLGVVPYPVMLLLAWLYTRTAERNELDFADNVED